LVLDTNIAVSASINPTGPPAQVILRWRAGEFTWATSLELLTELDRTLRSPRVAKYLSPSATTVAQFFMDVQKSAPIVVPSRKIDLVQRDPADNRVLEAALEAQADYIVSGDRDLLDIGNYEGIEVVTARRLLAIVQAGM